MTSRERLAWMVAGGAVLAAAVVITISVVPGNTIAGTAVPICVDDVNVFVDTDEEMRVLAEKLRGDHRIDELTTETKQQAYERFKILFKDQPELVELARPETLPAAVHVSAADNISSQDLARQLTTELSPAQVQASPLAC